MDRSANASVRICLLVGEGLLEQAVVDTLSARGIDCRLVSTLTEAERTGPGAGYDLLVVNSAVYGSETPAACRRLCASWPDRPLLLLTQPRYAPDPARLDPGWVVMPCGERPQDILPHLLLLMAERLLSAADSAAARAVLQAVMDAVDDGLSLTSMDGVTLYQNAAARAGRGAFTSTPLTDAGGQFFGAVNRSPGNGEVHAFEPARDPGTGLVCREVMLECLGHALARVARSGGRCALLLLDLDPRGGSVGQQDSGLRMLLNETGRRLACQLRRGDLVARTGPGVFAIVLEGVEATAETARVADKLLSSVSNAANGDARIGIAISPDDGEHPDSLMDAAGQALERARGSSGPAYAYSTEAAAESIARFLALSEGLDEALEQGQLDLHYQPQFDLASGKLTGFEALLRWHHPELGQVSPMEFVPVMERNGLINEAGAWVIRKACAQLAVWQKQFRRSDLAVAVNLSSRQLEDDALVSIVRRALESSGVNPACLELEVTESLLMADPDLAAQTLRRLTTIGVPVAIDDFGTGYSSLAYLKKLPVKGLKIDRSFMMGVPENRKDVSVIKGTIALARGLGLIVTAEGVETPEQVSCLKAHGCDRVQGYLFGRPVAEKEARNFLSPGDSDSSGSG